MATLFDPIRPGAIARPTRIRLLGEATQPLVDVWAGDDVSARLSPNGKTQAVNDAASDANFTAETAMLDSICITFLELREPLANGAFGGSDVPVVSLHIPKVFSGPLVLNSDDPAMAEEGEAVAAVAAS